MSFQEYKLNDFVEVLSSKEAVPGGGGASAYVGAIGVALGNMVGSLTVGKKTYAAVEDQVKEWMQKAEIIRTELLDAMDKDAESFLPLSKAYGIPKDDPGRDEIMAKALKVATEAPLELMRTVCKAIDLLEGFAQKGSKIAISDAGVGAVCCKAALQGASLNVFINTKSMKDREYAENVEKEADKMLDEYCKKADEIYGIVVAKIR